MKPPPVRYARPETLGEAVSLLASSDGDARVLAGGQSLLPRLNMRLDRPQVLVDVALVPELQVLRRDGDELVVGAGVTQRAAESSSLVRDACPLIPLALDHAGPLPVRARGTVGGSLAYADPAAELGGVAVALDATVAAVGPDGRRTIRAQDFFRGRHTTALRADEVLTEVRFPVLAGARCAFLETALRARTAAVAGVAAVRLADGDVRLAAVGVADTPVRLSSVDEPPSDGGYTGRVLAALVSRALERVAA